ncbi:prepilin-type N-terminal cleavage/methylation domain-containing protein [Acinetobacter johnsonii]|uniref:PilW family protein n=1 Tax=Acinetobacter johnsonii TaxID=40214 RepID=UPI00244BB2BE|nr:prepilin-type N-terminal cleavage/methylation domain-containing protein [Acinetobacter johnsonii]MDH1519521.1 prepilin-type N-terminal cleavage/methylation domain-containing protein [Acinetobacter johnsonii]
MKRTIVNNRHAQVGVSLIELMVGLTIGLIIAAGALAILFSNQKLILEKDVMDRSQENFRFASMTITRLVRQANELGIPANNNELIVTFDRAQRDCLGQVNNSWINTFKVNSNNELLCILNNDENLSYVLAKDIPEIKFSYGIQNGVSANSLVYRPRFSGNSNTESASVVNAWNTVTSVLTQMTVSEGNGKQPTLDFIATSHLLALTKLASSGGTSHANPPNENSGNSSSGSGGQSSGSGTTGGESGGNNTGEENNQNETPPTNTDNCSSDMLNNITITVGGSTYTWSNINKTIYAEKKSALVVNVNSSIDKTNWEIAEGSTFKSLTLKHDFSMPNPHGISMRLSLKCNGEIKSSLDFVSTK